MKQKRFKKYENYLNREDLEKSTIELYVRAAKKFENFRGKGKMDIVCLKEYVNMLEQNYKPATVNLYAVALNRYLTYFEHADLLVQVRRLRVKRSLENVISVEEYKCLLDYAKSSGREKYYAIMKVLAGTGIRIGELKYITVENVIQGYANVYNKGRSREIFISKELQKETLNYSNHAGIREGVIFRGTKGEPISRGAVWQMLKKMADMAGIPTGKVHPHSFRHMMALMYMKNYGNIAELADILGHSSIETTRIYTVTTKEEKRGRLGAMGL